jgi:YHS domain-containing protein
MHKNQLMSKLPLLIAALMLFVASTASALAPVYTSLFSDKALGGYDTVAYFTTGKPTEGDSQFTHEYQGATWYFSSAENRDAFIKSPEKYQPQYGGYCAWAISQGYSASGDPEFWKIVDGKLYLNYDQSVQEKWEKAIPDFITAADGHWPKLLKK